MAERLSLPRGKGTKTIEEGGGKDLDMGHKPQSPGVLCVTHQSTHVPLGTLSLPMLHRVEQLL